MSIEFGQLVEVDAGDGPNTLRAGIIDDDARYVFRYGQCGTLALAICELTGWPIWFIGYTDCEEGKGCRAPGYADYSLPADGGKRVSLCVCQVNHVGVLRPDGAFVDIFGSQPLELAQERFEADLADAAPPSMLADIRAGTRGWYEPDLPVARVFARRIVELVGAGS